MNIIKQVAESQVLYSCCSGHNLYVYDRNDSCTVFHKNKKLVRHVKTGEVYYLSQFPDAINDNLRLDFWTDAVRKPVDIRHFIWPADIVTIAQESSDTKYALIFSMRSLPVYDSIGTLLSRDLQAGWDKPWVRQLVSRLLDAWRSFYSSGYIYHEFSDDNIFYQKDSNNVLFDFSLSLQINTGIFDTHTVLPERIQPDYADPYYYAEYRKHRMDLASDYYSCAVILFKLMVGRLPYQGRIMEHEPNSNAQEHNSWIKLYHNNPVFIFDRKDKSNRIGGDTGFAKDEVFVERWNALPSKVRNMFHGVFQSSNAMRRSDRLTYYSPMQWADVLFGDDGDIMKS